MIPLPQPQRALENAFTVFAHYAAYREHLVWRSMGTWYKPPIWNSMHKRP